MGHVPDWARGSMKKTGPSQSKPGIVSRPIFHGETKVARLADGGTAFDYDNPGKVVGEYEPARETGETNIKGEKVGSYSGNDEIVMRRMNMMDSEGKDLRRKIDYDSIDSVIKDKSPAPAVEAKPVEPARDTTVKPAASAKVTVRKPKYSGESVESDDVVPKVAISPASKPARPSTSAVMHDESSGSYDQLKTVDRNRRFSTPLDGMIDKMKNLGADILKADDSDYKRN